MELMDQIADEAENSDDLDREDSSLEEEDENSDSFDDERGDFNITINPMLVN